MHPTASAEEQERSFHTEDVFTKTEQGDRESRVQTPESSLPRSLRNLLLAVDGQSPFRVYAKTLEDYGDVATMFNQLRKNGYVQLLEEPEAETEGNWLNGFRQRLSALTLRKTG